MTLEKHLVLNKYFLDLFGYEDFNQLREKLKEISEGFDNLGRSYFIDKIIALKPEWEEELLRYDRKIKEYVDHLRQNRNQLDLNLKYFQYLAVLFTEIFLDKYYHQKEKFLNELNQFLEKFNSKNNKNILPFTEKDLRKLAFWMATGSGKTLVMHINYWQIINYTKNFWDNIVLITPNEGLSRQHYEELKLSGIPCKIYDGNLDSLKTKPNEILIIEISKLTEEKKGEGLSIDISYFDGKNLVFIDEGHKGQKSEERTWKRLREEIGKTGFIFEYSATFGQVIGKDEELLEEYAKAIIFDYSYKYFYTDGYGKDFYVYNIKEEKNGKKEAYTQEQKDLLLTGGLLSFFEQLVIYEENKEELKEYNIERPLWIFVGSKVSGKGINSDIVQIIKYFEKILKDENYLKEKIEKIINEKTELIDQNGNDIFKGKYEYIKERYKLEEIINGIYEKIFKGRGKLELFEIKNAEGEMGLKTAIGENYFGLINVGEISELKKIITDIEIKDDHLSASIFNNINQENSNINILIGAKKFIEGWNSWRVSTIGLINMGKGEGPQIIQLFGRGVRLKGKNYSLKREENPDYKLKTLQTLYIFGLNADYMTNFLETIKQEGIEFQEIQVKIKFNQKEEWENKIYTIKTKESFNFLEHKIKLTYDEDLLTSIKIDLRPKIQFAHGLQTTTVETKTDEPIEIPKEYYSLIDWNKIYENITEYKLSKGMYNLILSKEEIKKIILPENSKPKYKIYLSEGKGIQIINHEKPILRITSMEGIETLHELLLMILKEYIEKYYKIQEKRKTMEYLEVAPLNIKEHSHLYPEGREITIKIPQSLKEDIEELRKQISEYLQGNIPKKWEDMESILIHFDKHIYTPLAIWQKNKEEIKTIPIKLNEGETKFIKDLRNYLKKNETLTTELKIFLLRNLSRRGIGFFTTYGFYPDFILWILKEDLQHMIFLDPKGIRNLGNFNDEKIKFCTDYIKEIEQKISPKVEQKLKLNAFILSISKYDDIKKTFGEGNLQKQDFENHNIYFQEDDNYIDKILKKARVI